MPSILTPDQEAEQERRKEEAQRQRNHEDAYYYYWRKENSQAFWANRAYSPEEVERERAAQVSDDLGRGDVTPKGKVPFKPGVLAREGYSDLVYDGEKFSFGMSGKVGDGTGTKAGYQAQMSKFIGNAQHAAASQGVGVCEIEFDKPHKAHIDVLLKQYEILAAEKPPKALEIGPMTRAFFLKHTSGQQDAHLHQQAREGVLTRFATVSDKVDALLKAEKRNMDRYLQYKHKLDDKKAGVDNTQKMDKWVNEIKNENPKKYSEDSRKGDVDKIFSSIPADTNGAKPVDARLAKAKEQVDMIDARMKTLVEATKELKSQVSTREKTLDDLTAKPREASKQSEEFNVVNGVRIQNKDKQSSRKELIDHLEAEQKDLQKLRDVWMKELSSSDYPKDPAVREPGKELPLATQLRDRLQKGNNDAPGADATKTFADLRQGFLRVDDKVNTLMKDLDPNQNKNTARPTP